MVLERERMGALWVGAPPASGLVNDTTEFVTQETGASHIDINGSDGEVTPARSISGGTAFTTTVPDDCQL